MPLEPYRYAALSDTKTLTVDLGERSYPIIIGSGLLAGGYDLAPHLAGPDCLIVTNETVAPLYLDKLRKSIDGDVSAVVLEDGEQHKTVASVEHVIDELVTARAGRDATVVALGGGVVGDIAGFAAASYMRGISFIQVPTTLLAQVDSSVGGKTGVNHPQGKNLIGAFHQPEAVLIDTETLGTLPDRELAAGLAEVIKYGAILDRRFFDFLERNAGNLLERDPRTLAEAIERSCEIKAAVVAADERETGRRALLNFGHTFGHAIESSLGYGEWLHGEAVAAGMVMAAAMSDIDATEKEQVRSIVEQVGLPSSPPTVGAARLRDAMHLDKKKQAGELRLILLRALGDAFVTSEFDEAALRRVLRWADG